MIRILLICAATALMALGFSVASLASKPPSPPGQDPCSHGNTGKPCRPDPQPGHGKDCDHHGNNGGVNEDHCAGTTTPPPPPPPPTTTQGTTTSTTPTTSTGTTTQSAPPTTLPPSTTTSESQSTTTAPAPAPKPKTKTAKTPSGGQALPGHKPKTRIFHGKPHAIIQGSG